MSIERITETRENILNEMIDSGHYNPKFHTDVNRNTSKNMKKFDEINRLRRNDIIQNHGSFDNYARCKHHPSYTKDRLQRKLMLSQLNTS